MNKEILLFDITTKQQPLATSNNELDNDLARIEAELDRYTNKASMEDYALAVASGILAGAIDATYVGDAGLFFFESPGNSPLQPTSIIRSQAMKQGASNEWLSTLNVGLQKAFKLAEENASLTNDANKAIVNNLQMLSSTPTPTGCAAAMAIQILRAFTSLSEAKAGPSNTNPPLSQSLAQILVPAVITGFLSWITVLAQNIDELDKQDESERQAWLTAIITVVTLAANTGMLEELTKNSETWFNEKLNEAAQSTVKPGEKIDVSRIVLELIRELANKPTLEKAGLANYLNQLPPSISGGGISLNTLGKQAIPVIVNETIVRLGFFISHLAQAFNNGASATNIKWADIVPISNRTVDRMMTIASMTLALADTTDAAVHASLESAGNWVLYSQRFVTRYNYVAAGRVAVAIVREFSDEAKEAQLIHERRLLIEARAAITIKRLEEYKAQLSELVDSYIAENLQAFFAGIDMMDEGIAQGDSNLVIAGNVTIQRVLGREPQFENQEEFDALMESDDDFIF